MEKHDLDDVHCFFDELSDVKPIAPPDTVAQKTKQPESLAQKLKRRAIEREVTEEKNGLSVENIEPIDPYEMLCYKQDGVQEGVFKNLRLGKYQIDSHIILTQLKFDEARRTLFESLQDCHKRGIRCVLVQHGLGLNSKPFKGFLKSYVKQWLSEIDIVIAYHSALKQHGGLRSVYVLLKKHPNQKIINREKNRRG